MKVKKMAVCVSLFNVWMGRVADARTKEISLARLVSETQRRVGVVLPEVYVLLTRACCRRFIIACRVLYSVYIKK